MVGEHFTWEKIRFEVMDMDGNRVDKVLVKVLSLSTEIEPEDNSKRS